MGSLYNYWVFIFIYNDAINGKLTNRYLYIKSQKKVKLYFNFVV